MTKEKAHEIHDRVIVDGTTGEVSGFLPRKRVMITWHDENGNEHTKTVWAKRCEIIEKYSGR